MSPSLFPLVAPDTPPSPLACSKLHSAQHFWAWSRFAETLRDRQVPGFARRAAAAQEQFDWFAEFAEAEDAFLAAQEDEILSHELPEPEDGDFI